MGRLARSPREGSGRWALLREAQHVGAELHLMHLLWWPAGRLLPSASQELVGEPCKLSQGRNEVRNTEVSGDMRSVVVCGHCVVRVLLGGAACVWCVMMCHVCEVIFATHNQR